MPSVRLQRLLERRAPQLPDVRCQGDDRNGSSTASVRPSRARDFTTGRGGRTPTTPAHSPRSGAGRPRPGSDPRGPRGWGAGRRHARSDSSDDRSRAFSEPDGPGNPESDATRDPNRLAQPDRFTDCQSDRAPDSVADAYTGADTRADPEANTRADPEAGQEPTRWREIRPRRTACARDLPSQGIARSPA